MSCNISIPLQRIIDDVAEALAGNYISVDNPFLNESVLTDTTFRGDITMDTEARNALCYILQTCDITAVELEWLAKPDTAGQVAASVVSDDGTIVSWVSWESVFDTYGYAPDTSIKRAYSTYVEMVGSLATMTDGMYIDVLADPVASLNGVYRHDSGGFTKISDAADDLEGRILVSGGAIKDSYVSVTKDATGAVKRTQADINNETLSLFDFGAVGDGVTNDNQSFVNLELDYQGRTIDLLGKTYVVTALPTKNTYINGYLKIDDVVLDVAASLPVYSDIVYTVGTGGDFATLNAALKFASKRHMKTYNLGGESISTGFKPDIVNITLLLKSGFVMSEQVIARQTDLSHITIRSEDAIVNINRAALNECTYFKGTTSEMYPAFYFGDNSVSPLIACLFEMDKTGVASKRHGIVVCRNSSIHTAPHSGVKGSGGHGLYLREASSGSARLGDFSFSGDTGIIVSNASMLDAHGGKVNNSANGAACYSSNLDIERGVITDCTTDGVIADSGATVNVQLANADRCGRYAVRANNGSTVFFGTSTGKNCGSYGINADAATVIANATDISGSAYGFRGMNGSTLSLVDSKAMNCARGLILTDASRASATNLNVSGYSEFGVYANIASTVSAANVVCGETPQSTDVQCANGSTVYIRGSAAGTSVTPGTYTINGIIII